MSKALLRTLFFVLIAVVSIVSSPAPSAPSANAALAAQEGGDQVTALVAKLKSDTDTADPKLIQQLVALRTLSAAEGLADVFGVMNSEFMRREVLKALAQFDGVADAEQLALQKIMDAATQTAESELRMFAIDTLGECVQKGKDFLRMIVVSPAEDSVRERAMEHHLKLADKNDFAWYKELYKPKPLDEKEQKTEKEREKAEKEREKKEKRDKGKKKEGEPEAPAAPKKARKLETLRTMAFDTIKGDLTPDEVVEALKDGSKKIRASALSELGKRNDKRVLDLATAMFDKLDEDAGNRVLAAQTMARISGTKVAAEFKKRALNVDTPVELQRGLGDILVGFHDAAIDRDLVGEIGKGKTHEKLFSLYLARKLSDEKVGKSVQKLLVDKEPGIVTEACRTLADRKEKDALPALQKVIEKGKDKTIIRATMEAIADLRLGEPGFVDDLVGWTKNDDPEIRSMALQMLGQVSDKGRIDKLVAALDDSYWSTRLAALRALERMRTKEVIRPIIDRMAKEDGRMLQEFADTLFNLAGQPYKDNAAGWSKWWTDHEATFEFVTPEQLAKLRAADEEYRLRQTTRVQSSSDKPKPGEKVKFFGIKIISHKVIFIIDISGSMNELLLEDYDGKSGQQRIDVAQGELEKCIQGLEPTAFFNIITFSSGVERWVDGGLAAANPKNQEEAKAYVKKLLPFGGTNLYGAVKQAFSDQDADTIFIMSDGEPSDGEVIEPLVIREHVKRWNEHRGVVINTISVGGRFQILDWLAEDSGGTHVKFE